MSDDSEFLNIKEASELLKVSETSLRRWTNSGRLTCLRVGVKGERRFRKSDLISFLKLQPTSNEQKTVGGMPVVNGTHLCTLYSNDIGRTKLAVEFLAEGLLKGCLCYLLATPQAAKEMFDQLKLLCPDLQKYVDGGSLVVSGYHEIGTSQIQYLQQKFKVAADKGIRSIRLVGNISDSRIAEKSIEEVIQFEKDYEQFIAQKFPIVTLCQYDTRKHTCNDIAEILKCHKDIFRYPSESLIF